MISFDAVGSKDVDSLLQMKAFSGLCKIGTLVREVNTVFVSNTYPIHASIVTGCQPYMHGIIDNTRPQPEKRVPDWYWYAKDFKVDTLFTAAHKKGLKVGSVLWPVTANASEIMYNMPEIFSNTTKSQIEVSLRAGSKLFQLQEFVRHGHKLKRNHQPHLDNFVLSVALDLLKKDLDLLFLHFADYDTTLHISGFSTASQQALSRLDKRLEKLLEATQTMEDLTVIVLSDHAQLPIKETLNPNKLLEKAGLLTMNKKGQVSDYSCWFHCCGGSGFLIAKEKNESILSRAKEALSQSPAFDRFLTDEELFLSGHTHLPFGISAKEGYAFSYGHEAANHGYTLDREKYKAFYLVSGKEINQNLALSGGSLLDVAPIVRRLLDLDMPKIQGRVIKGIFK